MRTPFICSKLQLSWIATTRMFAGYDLAPPDVQICSSPTSQHFARDATTEDREGSCDWYSEGKPWTGGGSNPMIKYMNFDKYIFEFWQKNIVNLNRKALNRRGELQTLDGVFSTVRQVKSSLGGSHARQLDLLKYKILFYKESHLISGKICNIRFNHWQRFQLNYQQDWVRGGRVF